MNKHSVLNRLVSLAQSKYLRIEGYNLVDIFIAEFYLAALAENSSGEKRSSFLRKKLFQLREYSKGRFIRSTIEPCNVLVVPSMRNHLDQIVPVARILTSSGFKVLFVTDKLGLYRELIKMGFHVHFVKDLFLLKSYPVSLAEMGDAVPEDFVSRNLQEWSSGIVKFSRTFDKLITRCRPNVLLCGYDITYEGRLAVRMSKAKGIATCCIQHGEMSGILNTQHIVDEFYLFGDASKTRLQQTNEDKTTKFIVTGAPYLDSLYKRTKNDWKSTVPAILGLPESNPYIFVAFSGPGNNTSLNHHKKLIEAIFLLEQEVRNLNIIIKLHPKDKIDYYQDCLVRYKNHSVTIISPSEVPKGLTVFDWLRGCTALITGASATAVESLLMDVPAVTMDLMDEYGEISFIENGATIHIKNENDLPGTITRLLTDSTFKKEVIERQHSYVKDFFYKTDGNSAQRCANEILKHIKK